MMHPRLHAVILGILALLPATLEAQGLVALLNPGGDRQLAALDPSTGSMHPVGPVIGGVPVSTSSGTEAIDAGGNRFFFVGTPNAGATKLYSISTIDGSVLASPNVSNAQNGILMMDWDAGESKLYCLVSVGAGDRQLCSVSTATGAVTLLGSPIAGASLSTAGFHALDEAQNRFFFVGTPNGGVESLYIISTATGLELASPDLTGPITSTRSLAWDAAESTLFGLFGLANFDAQLGTVNLATGVVTLRGNPLTGGTISSSGAALDAAADRYYFAGIPASANRTVYTLNTVNGLEIESHEITGASEDVLALKFDPGPLFADGFNSGNTSLWSATIP
jgi:DNA-binding beta-propeller fold protein YncE